MSKEYKMLKRDSDVEITANNPVEYLTLQSVYYKITTVQCSATHLDFIISVMRFLFYLFGFIKNDRDVKTSAVTTTLLRYDVVAAA